MTFSIGDITLGSATGKDTLTPVDFEPPANQSDYSQRVRNIVRLLQSMDMDDNPANGITLPPGIHQQATGLSLDLSQDSAGFENDPVVMTLTNNLGLVLESDALVHFRGTLRSLAIADLQGNYTLAGATVTDLQGNNIIPPGTTITGTMQITSNGLLSQTIYVNGLKGIASGIIEIYDHYRLMVLSLGCTYYIGYEFDASQGRLTTTLDTSDMIANGSKPSGLK